jgi:LysM repeat protein
MKMNTPNPLVPQGTFADGAVKSRTRIVVFTILAAHVVFVCMLLLQTAGCKRTPPEGATEAVNPPESFPPPNTNIFVPPTDLVTPTPPSNVVSTPPTNEVTPTPTPTPPTPPTPPAGPEKEHVIAKGENFYTLGKKYGVGFKAIAEANPGVDPTKLKIGQKVKIPAPKAKEGAPAGADAGSPAPAAAKAYTVKSGDTLMKIAKTHGVTIKALRSANNLKTDRIKVGDKLKIPAKGAAPATPPVEPPGATTPAVGTPTGNNI